MHLYKRNRIWWIEYVVDGVRYRQSTHTRKYAEAEQWMASIKTARKMPTFEEAVAVLKMLYRKPADGVIPLDAAWDRYVTLAKAIGKLNVQPKTLTDRCNYMRAFLDWLAHNAATIRTVEAVSGPVAAQYAQHLATQGLKSKTRQNNIGHLSTIWTILEKMSPDVRNPWKNLAPADTDHERISNFTPEQEESVLEAARVVGKDWLPICIIARHTGLRYGDIARLQWADIDLDSGVIRKTPHKTERYDIAVTLPIIEPVRNAIEGLARNGDYLFPLHAELYGKRGKAVQEMLSFREVLDKAGLKTGNYTFHSWRHTAATNLAAAGVAKDTRKLILGHTTDENADRYDHAEHLDEVRKAMEAAARV